MEWVVDGTPSYPGVLAALSRMPEMVIFDCDGVVIDSERLAVVLEVEMLAGLGWPLTPIEVIERFMGRSAA